MKEKETWTDEQFVKYFTEGNVEKKDIESWTCEQCVSYVHHFLNQKWATTHMYVSGLRPEVSQTDLKNDALKEISAIRNLNNILEFWLMKSREKGS